MSDLKSLAELWHRRAGVADTAAAELGGLSSEVAQVLSRNHFGTGCVEGEVLFDRLGKILDGAVAQMGALSDFAADVAKASVAAEVGYRTADAESAEGLSS